MISPFNDVSNFLLAHINDNLPGAMPIFEMRAPAYEELRSLTASTQDPFNPTEFAPLSEPACVWIQLFVLANLTMMGGIMSPGIKQLSTQPKLSIQWADAVWTPITLGKWDEDWVRFLKRFLSLTGAPAHSIRSMEHFLSGIVKIALTHVSGLKQSKTQLTELKNSPAFFGSKEMLSSTLFTILAALPVDSLSAFFVHLHSFFPEEFSVKMSGGASVNVASFFGKSGVDMKMLAEKIRVYANLYELDEHPIIKEITRSKSSQYLRSILANSEAQHAVQAQITRTIDDILEPRIKLFELMLHIAKSFEKVRIV